MVQLNQGKVLFNFHYEQLAIRLPNLVFGNSVLGVFM